METLTPDERVFIYDLIDTYGLVHVLGAITEYMDGKSVTCDLMGATQSSVMLRQQLEHLANANSKISLLPRRVYDYVDTIQE